MPSTTKDLSDWLARAADGDRAAFSRLYDASASKLYGVILRIIKDRSRSDDLLQDIFMKIWERAGTFDRDRASPITWMATIARNSAIDEIRRRSREFQMTEADVAEVPDMTPRADVAIEQKEAWLRLESCLETLDLEHRDTVKLAYLEGLSREEISTRLSIPVGTVKTWLHRSLKRLKECLVG